jgi:hypothetical protein
MQISGTGHSSFWSAPLRGPERLLLSGSSLGWTGTSPLFSSDGMAEMPAYKRHICSCKPKV